MSLILISEVLSQNTLNISNFLEEQNIYGELLIRLDSTKNTIEQSVSSEQTTAERIPFAWVSAGIGDCYVGITSYYSISIAYKANIITLRYIESKESYLNFNVGGYIYDNPEVSIRERGILYGRFYRKEFLVLSLSAGVGFISGVDRGKKLRENQFEQIDISTYGIPIEAKFRLEIGFVGIGGGWFGNLNNKKFISGGMVEIYLLFIN